MATFSVHACDNVVSPKWYAYLSKVARCPFCGKLVEARQEKVIACSPEDARVADGLVEEED